MVDDEREARGKRPTLREPKGVVTATVPKIPEDRDPELRGFDDTSPASPSAHAQRLRALQDEIVALKDQRDGAYAERNRVVAALARICRVLGMNVGTRSDPNPEVGPEWVVLFIDLPTGQVSWHFHQREMDLLRGLPHYRGVWDGHDTPEKYQRLRTWMSRYSP